MSLISQMLKDLDKRQGGVGEEQSLLINVRHVPRRRSLGGPILVFGLAVVIVGSAALVWTKFKPEGPPASKVVVAAAGPSTESAPSKTSQPAPSPDPADRSSPPAVTAPAPPSASEPTAPVPPLPLATRRILDSPPDSPAAPSVAPEKLASVPSPAPTPKSAVAQAPISTRVPASPTEPERAQKPASTPTPTPSSSGARAATAPTPSARTPIKKPAPVQPVLAEDRTVSQKQPPSMKVFSPQQRSQNAYRQAVALLQQGRATEAVENLKQALEYFLQNHAARELLARLLIDANHHSEATALLREGLKIAPSHTAFVMILARMQVSMGGKEIALQTLEQSLPLAGRDPQYHGFLAALLLDNGLHARAVEHYIVALQSDPVNPTWLIGIGISLEAINKSNDAAEAYQRAIATGRLTPQLTKFAERQLGKIREQR